jgi:hypothetical protein
VVHAFGKDSNLAAVNAMANNKVLSPTESDRTEWAKAWEAVNWLAAARRTSLHEIYHIDRSVSEVYSTTDVLIASTSPDDPHHRARAIAQIEQAYGALGWTEPALEVWLPDRLQAAEPRGPGSVWMLIGGIWITTLLVVAGAIGAIVYLLG